eukprot:2469076-Prymnesium_polylepis.1
MASDGSAFYSKFDKAGRPSGPGGYTFTNGSYVKGHSAAPPIVRAARASSTTPRLTRHSFCGGRLPTLACAPVACRQDAEEGDEAPPPPPPSVWYGSAVGVAEATQDGLMKRDYCAVKPIVNIVIAGAPASGKGCAHPHDWREWPRARVVPPTRMGFWEERATAACPWRAGRSARRLLRCSSSSTSRRATCCARPPRT